MKKTIGYVLGLIAVLVSFACCVLPAPAEEEASSMTLSLQMPYYREAASASRVVDAGTAFIELYLDEIQYYDLPISEGDTSGGGVGVPSQWDISLSVPTGTYTIRAVLCDTDHNPLTEGTVEDVEFSYTETTIVEIGCLPVTSVPIATDGTPWIGEVGMGSMVFFNFPAVPGNGFDVTTSPESGYPDAYYYNADGSLESFSLNFGGPTTYRFVASQAGTQYVGVYGYSDSEFTLSIAYAGEHPVADAGPDRCAYSGEATAFDASESYVNGGATIVSYDWDFGDGSSASESDPTVEHVFAATGVYTVTLTLTDTNGRLGTDTVYVTVGERPDHILITEIYGGYGAIEVYNPTDSAIDLNGWTLLVDGDWYGPFVCPLDSDFIIPAGSHAFFCSYDPSAWASEVNRYSEVLDYHLDLWGQATVALVDVGGTGVDFVQINTDEYTPPAGTAWNSESGNVRFRGRGQSVSRRSLYFDTDSALDWFETYETIGYPSDYTGAVDLNYILR